MTVRVSGSAPSSKVNIRLWLPVSMPEISDLPIMTLPSLRIMLLSMLEPMYLSSSETEKIFESELVWKRKPESAALSHTISELAVTIFFGSSGLISS